MGFIEILSQLPAFNAVKNNVCKNHTLETLQHLLQASPWAIKMFDSSTKLPDGVLLGTYIDLGNYDECLEVQVEEEWGSFKGQHCLASVPLNVSSLSSMLKVQEPLVLPFTWAMCVPSSCAASDLAEFLSTTFRSTISVNPLECHVQESRRFESLDWLAIGVLSFFGLLCLLSTGYDLIVTDPSSRKAGLLVFSWYTNGKQLFSTGSSADTMECMHGLRFLTIVWVVLGHTYFMSVVVPSINIIKFGDQVRDWAHVFVTGALSAVDTFLLLSGALLCNIFLKTMTRGKKFNLPVYCLHRFLRTTPLLAIGVLVHAGLIMHLASGPLWDSRMSWLMSTCKKNWWTAIFHLQNYVRPTEMCMPVTWYLAVDMQLYLLSPLLLLPLFKWPRIGIILLQVTTVGSVISCFLQLYLDETLVPIIKLGTTTPLNYFYTHTRAAPWFLGMSLGYLLFHTSQWRKDVASGTQTGLPKTIVAAGWLLGTVCLLAPVLTLHQFTQESFFPNLLETTSYTTFSRPIWSIGVCWIIFACVSGYGGPVNTFLSWKFFRPLGRLTFSIYVMHMAYLRVTLYSVKALVHHDDMNKITSSFSTLVFVGLLAVPASLMFESPVICIERLLFGGNKGTAKKIETFSPDLPESTEQEGKPKNDPLSSSMVLPHADVVQRTNSITQYPSAFNICEENGPQNRT